MLDAYSALGYNSNGDDCPIDDNGGDACGLNGT